MTEIEPSGCECFRVFAAIETFSALDVSRRCRDRSGAANWRQSENEVKHYTCFISALVRAFRIYPLCGALPHFFVVIKSFEVRWSTFFKSKNHMSTNFAGTVLHDHWVDSRFDYISLKLTYPEAYD